MSGRSPPLYCTLIVNHYAQPPIITQHNHMINTYGVVTSIVLRSIIVPLRHTGIGAWVNSKMYTIYSILYNNTGSTRSLLAKNGRKWALANQIWPATFSALLFPRTPLFGQKSTGSSRFWPLPLFILHTSLRHIVCGPITYNNLKSTLFTGTVNHTRRIITSYFLNKRSFTGANSFFIHKCYYYKFCTLDCRYYNPLTIHLSKVSGKVFRDAPPHDEQTLVVL